MSEDRPQYQAERDTVPTPLPKNARCHRCGEWFANAHVCADQVTLKPAEPRDTVPTNAEIAERLRDVCAQMLVLSIDMLYVGGFGETAKKGDALALLARHLFVWAHEIEGAQG